MCIVAETLNTITKINSCSGSEADFDVDGGVVPGF